MANVAFKKGLLANLPVAKSAGTFYVTTDERAIYLDVDGSNRIRIGDFQEFATVAALEANTNPSTTALYYVTAINCLAKWDGSKYVQINLDTGATDIEVVGSGNAVTSATYDSTTRKITLTKGTTFATKSELDAAIGESTDASTAITLYGVKKYAQEQAAAVLGSDSDSAGDATVYGANKAAAAAQAAADAAQEAADDAQAAADAAQGDVDALEQKVGDIPQGATATTVTGYAKEVADAAEAAAKAVANAKVASIAAGNGISVDNTTPTAPEVSVKLQSSDNDLAFNANGELFYKAAAAAEYAIEQQATAETGYAATYFLTKDGVQAGAKINIPKDFLVKSASVETVETADVPYSGAQVGDKYIDFVINAKDASATAEHLYLPVNDLVDVYTSGSQSGDMVVIAIDGNNQITASITDGTITLAKLHSDVQAEINKAHTHSNKALLDTYTQTEADLADAVSKKHEHANKSELDLFETGDKSKLDTAASKAAANESAITNMKDGDNLDSFGDVEDALDLKAPLASPALTGTPTAPTAAAGTDSTQIATTAFVKAALDAGLEWGSF